MWFLVFVVVASAIGISIVVSRHKPRTSTESSIADFGRNLDALAPPPGSTRGARPKRRDHRGA